MLTLPICFLTDIQGNITGASGNNSFFNQPFFNPELKVPAGMVHLVVRYLVRTILRFHLQVLHMNKIFQHYLSPPNITYSLSKHPKITWSTSVMTANLEEHFILK